LISVIICTYNRELVLKDTVCSFLNCKSDGLEHELLLIDNNLKDKTSEVARSFEKEFPRIVRYIKEEKIGLSYARNRGIEESRGDIIAFADDDVFFSKNWLKGIENGFKNNRDFFCLGGRVTPHFDDGRPSWIDNSLLCIYGVTTFGEYEKEIKFPYVPIGCNMAFKKIVFDQLGGFNILLGRQAGKLLSNEEKYFFKRIYNAGVKTIYIPDVQVFHRIPKERTQREWILRRFYWQGISDIAMNWVGLKDIKKKDVMEEFFLCLKEILIKLKKIKNYPNRKFNYKMSITINEKANFIYEIGKLRQLLRQFIL